MGEEGKNYPVSHSRKNFFRFFFFLFLSYLLPLLPLFVRLSFPPFFFTNFGKSLKGNRNPIRDMENNGQELLRGLDTISRR